MINFIIYRLDNNEILRTQDSHSMSNAKKCAKYEAKLYIDKGIDVIIKYFYIELDR